MEQAQERRLTKAEFGFVESKLYAYKTNKQVIAEYEAQRQDVIEGTKHREKGVPGNQGVGKPVESTVIQLALLERKVQCELFWVKAIEDTLKLLSAEDRRLVELKYFEGYLTNEGIMMEMNMERKRFYKRRQDIVSRFAQRFTLV